MQIDVVHENGRYIARASFAQKDIVKAAGFRWDPVQKVWWTADQSIAAKLSDVDALAQKIEAANIAKKESIEMSRQADADIEIPVPEGLAYLPYQKAGIAYAMKRSKVLIADEMGLGKTIQAIGVINSDDTIRRILVICPASLRLNWRREMQKWLVRPLTIAIANGPSCPVNSSDILIANYDIADRHQDALRSIAWDLVILDEAHYLKNAKAKRTIAILGKERTRKEEGIPSIHCRSMAALTGTPIPNRPIEGWTLFRALGVFSNFFSYAKRYCDGHQNGYGWDFTGSSNLDELQEKLRASVMVRRLKKDVLTELPPKRRAVIELPVSDRDGARAVNAEMKALARQDDIMADLRAAVELAKASDDEDDYRAAVERLTAASRAAFTELSSLRHDTAIAKLPYVIEHLRNIIEQEQKVICFVHHKDVAEALMQEFGDVAVKITGDVAMQDRQAAVDRFQSDPKCLLFVGNIMAAGVGLTLTASSHVVFAELDWVPGNITQCEDRAHRISQRDTVLVEHLVLEGSLDARMASVLVEKQEVLAAALDTVQESAPIAPRIEREPAATESASRKDISEAAAKMTESEILSVHQKLRYLADCCDGARERDGAGFNKIDSAIGRALASCIFLTPRQAALGAKIVRRYRKQLEHACPVA